MEWCVDTRVAGAAPIGETEICAHLARHAFDPALAELARPVVREMLGQVPAGPLWVSLDWEEQLPNLSVCRLPDGPLPGTLVAPGVTLAHVEAARLVAENPAPGRVSVEVRVARAPEPDLDPSPAEPDLVPEAQPAAVAGLLSRELAAGRSLDEAAARGGATLAERVARQQALVSEAMATAEALIEAERQLGGDFRLISATGNRAVIDNHRCPFGPSAP